MTFDEMLEELRKGKLMRQPGEAILKFQEMVVPVWTTPPNTNCASWRMCSLVVVADCEENRRLWFGIGVPCGFTPAQVAATNWEVVP